MSKIAGLRFIPMMKIEWYISVIRRIVLLLQKKVFQVRNTRSFVQKKKVHIIPTLWIDHWYDSKSFFGFLLFSRSFSFALALLCFLFSYHFVFSMYGFRPTICVAFLLTKVLVIAPFLHLFLFTLLYRFIVLQLVHHLHIIG